MAEQTMDTWYAVQYDMIFYNNYHLKLLGFAESLDLKSYLFFWFWKRHLAATPYLFLKYITPWIFSV